VPSGNGPESHGPVAWPSPQNGYETMQQPGHDPVRRRRQTRWSDKNGLR